MNTHADKTPENKKQSVANLTSEHTNRSTSALPFTDNRPVALVQRKMQEAINNSPKVIQQNKTGLPDKLKSGIENLSGISMDNTRVHYNSAQPAQLNAHAYAQGNDIHLAPGQEKHLAHEAWHVVQQKQGRVKATMQMKGIGVNDDTSLEREADVMGAKAMQMKSHHAVKKETNNIPASGTVIIQRKGVKKTFFEAGDKIDQLKTETDAVKTIFTSVFDAVYDAYKPKNYATVQASQSRDENTMFYSQNKAAHKTSGLPSPRTKDASKEANALNSARRIKTWSETAYQSAARIFQELHAVQEVHNLDLSSVKMGINTDTEPDAFVKDHAGNSHAIESKRVSSPAYTQVDANIDAASFQLGKRYATGQYHYLQAHIIIDNHNNTWPYTRAAYQNALNSGNFSNLNALAIERLKHYKDASGFNVHTPITFIVGWANTNFNLQGVLYNYTIT